MKNKQINPNHTLLKPIEKAIDLFMALIPRQVPDKETLKKTRLIAHRGAHSTALGIQENTHEAFQRALELGCWGIELDVHGSVDNVVVVNHDPTLKRLWKKELSIATSHFKTLRAACPTLPSLEEVVRDYGKKLHLFIEIKGPFHCVESLKEVLSPLEPCTDYHLIALKPEILKKLEIFPKKSLLLVPMHKNVKSYCRLSIEKQYGGVLGHYLLLKDNYINALQAQGQIAGVGFVDSKNSLFRELNRGLSYLFSNNVALVAGYLNQLRGETTYKK